MGSRELYDSYHWISLNRIVRGLCSLVESKSKNRNKVKKKGRKGKKSRSIFSFFKIYFLICGWNCRVIWTIEPLSISRDWSQVMRIEDNVKRESYLSFFSLVREKTLRENRIVMLLWGPICVVKLKWNKEL